MAYHHRQNSSVASSVPNRQTGCVCSKVCHRLDCTVMWSPVPHGTPNETVAVMLPYWKVYYRWFWRQLSSLASKQINCSSQLAVQCWIMPIKWKLELCHYSPDSAFRFHSISIGTFHKVKHLSPAAHHQTMRDVTFNGRLTIFKCVCLCACKCEGWCVVSVQIEMKRHQHGNSTADSS